MAKTYLDENGNPINAHGSPAYLDDSGNPIAQAADPMSPPPMPRVPQGIHDALGILQGKVNAQYSGVDNFRQNVNDVGDEVKRMAGVGAGVAMRPISAVTGAVTNAVQAGGRVLSGNGSGTDIMLANPATSLPTQTLMSLPGMLKKISTGDPYDIKSTPPFESGMNTGAGLFDAASLGAGLVKAPPTMASVAGRTLGGAVADVSGAALPGKIVPEVARTAGPELAQSARATGAVPSGESGPSTVRGWANDAISRIESHVDQLHEAAGGDSTPVNLKSLVDSLGNEEATHATISPSRSNAYGTMRQRVQAVESLGDLRNLKKALNRESDPAMNTTSNADQSHAIQAAGDALKGLRQSQYQFLAERTGVPAEQVQALMARENAVMDMRDMFGRAEPAIRNADAAANAPTSIGSKAGKAIRFLTGHQPMVKVMVNGTEQMLPTSALGDFNLRAGKFMREAPDVPVSYPEPQPAAVQGSRLSDLISSMKLDQMRGQVPSGPATTPMDDFLRLNRPEWRAPDLGQAHHEIMGQPLMLDELLRQASTGKRPRS